MFFLKSLASDGLRLVIIFLTVKNQKHRSCRKYAWIAPVTDHRKFRKNIHMCAMWSHKMQMVDLAGFTQHSKYVSSIVCLSETWKAMAKMAAEMCSCVGRRNYLGGQRNVIAAFGNTRPPKHRKLRPRQAQNGTKLVKLTPNGFGTRLEVNIFLTVRVFFLFKSQLQLNGHCQI